MKTIIGILLVVFAFQISANAQCDAGKDKLIEKYVKGIPLMKEVYDNKKDKPYEMVFNIGVTYGIYLLNPSSELPDLKLIQKETGKAVNGVKIINDEENYVSFIFTIEKSGQYKVVLDFESKKKACVLFVLSFIGKDMKK